jgi:hypothetical protein
MSAPVDLNFIVDGKEISFPKESNPLFMELWSQSGAVMLSKKGKDCPFVNGCKPLREMKCREFQAHDWTMTDAYYCMQAMIVQLQIVDSELEKRELALPPDSERKRAIEEQRKDIIMRFEALTQDE